MSRAATVWGKMVVVLDSLLSSVSGYKRIPNVDTLDDNINSVIRKGYGLRYNGASPSQGELHNFVNNHSFSVILTREVVKLETQVTAYDTAVKELFDDAYTIQRDFMNADQIGEETSIRLIDIGNVSGVTDIFSNNKRFKTIDVNFNILVSEDI